MNQGVNAGGLDSVEHLSKQNNQPDFDEVVDVAEDPK
jgi:hypothetical protein